MKRREFLKKGLFASLGGLGISTGFPFGSVVKAAGVENGKTLIVIFQRGGCDGLNTCVPYGDNHYYKLRPGIAIAPPDSMNSDSAIDLNGFFGLHPALAPLKPINDLGNMAIIPAAHYPGGSHSHFDGQSIIESGIKSTQHDGWLNRHLMSSQKNALLRAVAFATRLPQSLNGGFPVSVFRELGEYNLDVPVELESRIVSDLTELFKSPSSRARPYSDMLRQAGRSMLNDLDVIGGIDTTGYGSENGAAYPATFFGRQMKQLAQLIKAKVGLEVATIDLDGWDTHSGQGGGSRLGKQYNSLFNMSQGIAALYHDLGDRMNDVVIMTCTEFGRTAKQNASGGTDHGNASTWFVLGNSVRGGIYGEWPGLATDQLYRGRYLDFTIDYRDIMGDILWRHLGNSDLDAMLPGHQYTPVGLFG